MKKFFNRLNLVGVAVLTLGLLRFTPQCRATIYSNAGSITINNGAIVAATPYPSSIVVSGAVGTITSVKVILRNVTKDRASDIDVLLVGPGGQKFVVISDAGGNTVAINNVTATFDSASATVFEDSGGVNGWGAANSSSTSRPANWTSTADTFPSPAPVGPYEQPAGDGGGTATFDSVFDGAAPNGTWSLYVVDDIATGTAGSIAGGWSLDITSVAAAATSTTLASSVNPSFTTAPTNQTTLTATVTSSSTVSEGTVTFRDNGVALPGASTVNVVSGQAQFITTITNEGARQLTAIYNGTANFATSTSSTLSQEVNNHTTVAGSVYSNDRSGITINENNGSNLGIPSPYPSKIFVSGVAGTITDLNVVLRNVSEPRASDIDVLLVGPLGQKFVLVSDAGGNVSVITNVTVTFDDSSATLFGDSGAVTGWGTPGATVTARPVNRTDTTDTFPAPAPAAPYQFPEGDGGGTATLASVFNGGSPNGTWSLYLVDDAQSGGLNGSIAGGWSLSFTFAVAAATTTTVTSDNNPSFTAAPSNSVIFTATVTSGSTVNEGTLTFRDNGVALPGTSTVNVVSGQARYTNTFAIEGNHPITAVYNGTANFGTSTGNATQEVNNHTTSNGNTFSNSLSGITINENDGSNLGKAGPYPSKIFVSGFSGNIGDLNVVLRNVTEQRASDIDILLVGPLGQKFVLVSDAGGNTAGITNVTVTFDDSSATLFGDSSATTGWGAANATVTARPVNRTDTSDTFPASAPAAPYQFPEGDGGGTATLASVFNNTNPNGTWSLYLVDDSANAGLNGAIAGGWSLAFTPANVAPQISCPANLTTNTSGSCPRDVAFAATVTAGFPAPVLSYKIGATPITSPYAFPVGTNIVTSTATNSTGTNSCNFTVTVAAGAAPQLNILRSSTNVVVSWTNLFPCYALQFAPLLASNSWSSYPGPFATNNGKIFVTNTAPFTNRFFRLKF